MVGGKWRFGRAEVDGWVLFWLETRVEGGRKPPTSHHNSLVAVLGKAEGGGRWKATNESRRLVGGGLGEQREMDGGCFGVKDGGR